MARRTLFCLFLFFVRDYGTLQCLYFFISNLWYIAYCAKVMPYINGTANFVLLFSEGCLLVLSLLYFHFRSYDNSPSADNYGTVCYFDIW